MVFGDIGTSPIYTIQTIFNPGDPHPVTAAAESVYGLLSLVFWSVTIIVTVLYVGLVLRADRHGEGGILSLITLLPGRQQRAGTSRRTLKVLATLGVFGASLFLADNMITPAISVLSAVEGLRIVQPDLERLVIPLTIVIIVALVRGATRWPGCSDPSWLCGSPRSGPRASPESPPTLPSCVPCHRPTRSVS